MPLRQTDEHTNLFQPLALPLSGEDPADAVNDEAAEREKRYIENHGNECLHCGSTDIEGGFVEIDQGAASQTIICNDCRASWADVYKLTAIEELEDPQRSDEEEDDDG